MHKSTCLAEITLEITEITSCRWSQPLDAEHQAAPVCSPPSLAPSPAPSPCPAHASGAEQDVFVFLRVPVFVFLYRLELAGSCSVCSRKACVYQDFWAVFAKVLEGLGTGKTQNNIYQSFSFLRYLGCIFPILFFVSSFPPSQALQPFFLSFVSLPPSRR